MDGLRHDRMGIVKRKSSMKEIYRTAGVRVGRKRGKRYTRDPGEILAAFGGLIVHHEEIDSIFRAAIGDYGYLVRSKDLDEVRAAARYIQETA